jgi:hypothetical protein
MLGAATLAITALAAPEPETPFEWMTVVNNNDLIPPLEQRTFNSYNQPSVNTNGLVVMRARSRGGPPLGPPTHGIYTRDMSNANSEIVMVLDKTTPVPGPNNLGTTFVETPSFPRIDMRSNTIATRGNHQPVHSYDPGDGSETRAGTTGIYTNPFGDLIAGAAKLGHVPGFGFFGVPDYNAVPFEVFPGAPSVTSGNTIVFKGNYTHHDIAKTGVYFRHLRPEQAGGDSQAFTIADTDTKIPGTGTNFGSTAPPNAAAHKAVFAGFDNEEDPKKGGIYLAPLTSDLPPLTTLVSIGQRVPGDTTKGSFNVLGEGVAFDGRYVGFWGAWGDDTRTLRLYCQEEGNKDRIAYCNQELVCRDTVETLGDPNSVCDDATDPNYGQHCYQERDVPMNQGIFVHDTRTKRTHLVAREGGEDDGESVRWRSSAFVAVSAGYGATFRSAFKARTADSFGLTYVDPVDGIYLSEGPGRQLITTVADTTMLGQALDPEAPPDSTIVGVGLEREGLRGRWLTINASMDVEGGEEEDGMAGVYITQVD